MMADEFNFINVEDDDIAQNTLAEKGKGNIKLIINLIIDIFRFCTIIFNFLLR